MDWYKRVIVLLFYFYVCDATFGRFGYGNWGHRLWNPGWNGHRFGHGHHGPNQGQRPHWQRHGHGYGRPRYQHLIPNNQMCQRQCMNNGVCVDANTCSCPPNYHGQYCEIPKASCQSEPPPTKNAVTKCSMELGQCTITCNNGSKFFDGSTTANVECTNGTWVPTRNDFFIIPNCEPECNPPCLNSGVCLPQNICLCLSRYKGPQCQIVSSECDINKLGFNGRSVCKGDSQRYSCKLICPSGSYSTPPAEIYTCRFATGVYLPQPIPHCLIKTCSNGKQYKKCGPALQPSCEFPSPPVPTKTALAACVEGCFCPEGLLLEGDRCIPKAECPCRLRNRTFQPGYSTMQDCNNCTCVAGEWSCTQNPCGARCSAVGDPHYTTFDGRHYDFMGRCSYTFFTSGDIDIVVENVACISNQPVFVTSKNSTGVPSCTKSVSISYNGDKIHLKQGSVILANGREISTLPNIVGDIIIRAASSLFTIVQLPNNVNIWWDGNTIVHVDVPPEFKHKTKGLCGTFNNDPTDDFMTPENNVEESISTFANKWKTVDSCIDIDNKDPVHPCKPNVQNKEAAEKYCSILKSELFAPCHWNVDVQTYYDSCIYDMCACAGDVSRCLCPILGDYAMACADAGVKVQWRQNVKECQIPCTGGQEYTVCADSCLHKCSDRGLVNTGTCKPSCVEGCVCPSGQLLNENGVCVPVGLCPCYHKGRAFELGFKEETPGIRKGHICTCQAGEWACTEVESWARASAVGDPHYTTFDGRRYDFMGRCSYTFFTSGDIDVVVENVACIGNQPVFVTPENSTGVPSCTKSVSISYNGNKIHLKQGGVTLANGKEISTLPNIVGDIIIRAASSLFTIVQLPNDVKIWWDGNTAVHVDVPPEFKHKTKGLCGTFNNDPTDDFLTPENNLEQSISTFANKWKTVDSCIDTDTEEPVHPCKANAQNKQAAEKYCSKLKSELFAPCHWNVGVQQYYESCIYDMCACAGDVSRCLCPILGDYAMACADAGVKVQWRQNVKECEISCTGGQEYTVCADSCLHKCSDRGLVNTGTCKPSCVEGCACPPGQLLNDNGVCVPVGLCPCYHKGRAFELGFKEETPGIRKGHICSCQAGEWACTEVSTGARCSTVGDPHYTTFDGRQYDFMGRCSYTFFTSGDIDIVVENVACISNQPVYVTPENSTGVPSCTKSVSISYNGDKIHLKQGGVTLANEKEISTLPAIVGDIIIRAASSLFTVVQLPNKVNIWWDGNTVVHVDVPPEFKHKTKGLCGTFNNDPTDDFLTPENKVEESISIFANKWKTVDSCIDTDTEDPVHPCKANAQNKEAAEKYCSKLKSELFAPCHWNVGVQQYYESCIYDMCACADDVSRCLCPILGDYAMACADAGVKVQWRQNVKECEMSCTGGQEYTVCADSCLHKCSDRGLVNTGTCKPSCVEGCACPSGQLLNNNGLCVPVGHCPCYHKGRAFELGFKEETPGIRKGHICSCQAGEWACTEVSTGARCSTVGDPHYTTFDGRQYDFMGRCSYTFFTSGDIDIVVENVACISNQPVYVTPENSTGVPSCTKSVSISYNGDKIHLKQGGVTLANEKEISTLPAIVGDIIIRAASSLFTVVQLPNKVNIWWDGNTVVHVDVPPEFKHKTKGLCGTFNNDPTDDFLTPENKVEESISIFANTWKTVDSCIDTDTEDPVHPCKANAQNKEAAEKYCSKLKSELFAPCHSKVAVQTYYESCVYDMCACADDVSRCLCPILGDYAMACADAGVKVQWRQNVKECELPCSGGQEYTVCADSCLRKCSDIELVESVSCQPTCAEGCACPTGQLLNDNGVCVPVELCPCYHKGRAFELGFKEDTPGIREGQICECKNGKWSCTKLMGVCSAWGDSHLITFDGRDYDFEGACTYLLAKGVTDGNDRFAVEIQNVPCGTTGATCSKSVTLKVSSGSNEEIVSLTKNAPAPNISKLKRIKLRIAGSYVFLDVPSLGMSLQWDGELRVYVRIDSMWQNKVQGLCGNYNGDRSDDFQALGGGTVQSSALAFADSWKLQPTCPKPKAATDHCKQRPERQQWAQESCDALNHHPLSLCHAKVPVRPFVRRCERDACACDAGGDCACVCTALAAYAHACSLKGLYLHWRMPQLCPMQCDEECSNYDECVSPCPAETCDNTLYYTEMKNNCEQDTCVEGCKRKKSCPEGTIYKNSLMTECVPRADCEPTDKGSTENTVPATERPNIPTQGDDYDDEIPSIHHRFGEGSEIPTTTTMKVPVPF